MPVLCHHPTDLCLHHMHQERMREVAEHEETVRNLEAAVGDLKAQLEAAKKQQRCVGALVCCEG